MSLYDYTIPQLKKCLSSLDKWLEKGAAFAKTKAFDANVLANARLAPDMYPLARQVQSACDGAKFIAARLAGKDPPKHPDTETTVDELHARIRSVLGYLDTITPADFVGAEQRMVKLGFMEGKGLVGTDFLFELGLPNFYFHLTTAYAILRHNGVDLGKQDFLGSLNLRDL